MKARLRAAGPAAYVALLVVEAVAGWGARVLIVRIALTVMCGLTVYWFLQYRSAHRSLAEAERRRAMMRRRSWMN